jgi:ribose 5-phosphate isomerase B
MNNKMETSEKINNSKAKGKKVLMRIGISTDFFWVELKQKLIESLNVVGYELVDIEEYELVPGENYPDFVVPLTIAVSDVNHINNFTDVNDACVEVNKIPGVCATVITEPSVTGLEIEDEDLYVRCLGGQIKGYAISKKKVMNFLNADCPTSIPSNQRLAKVRFLKRENKTRIEETYSI